MKICLDAGHYGKYNQSPCDNNYYESDMVWKLTQLQKKYLEKYGIEVITTRASQEKDWALYERGTVSKGCGLFISNHSNAVGSGVNNNIDYPVSYCVVNGAADDIGLALAQTVEHVMGTVQAARIEHRSGSNGDYYGVLRGAAAVATPGLILENSFHTHTKSTAWLLNENNLDQLARAQADTIARFYGIAEDKKVYTSGWNHDANGWWYANSETTYYKQCWQIINGHKYYFNPDGYAVTDWQEIGGKWYYFEPRAGHDLECALYVSGTDGAQTIGMF